jgi:hypothetical protein
VETAEKREISRYCSTGIYYFRKLADFKEAYGASGLYTTDRIKEYYVAPLYNELIRKGKAHPAGIIAAPVGFVHVCESKHMVKPFRAIPKIIVEGRKGGSNLAATLCNAILCFDDAAQLKPGRDL